MYNSSLGCKHPDFDPERTALGPWSNSNATAALMAAGDAKLAFILMEIHRKDFHGQVSLYFHDLLPLVDEW